MCFLISVWCILLVNKDISVMEMVFYDVQVLVEVVCESMYDVDVCSCWFGMCVEVVVLGYVWFFMMVWFEFFNGYCICYGGLIFMLVDLVFVFVCNSYNYNIVVVGCSVEFLCLVYGGDVFVVEVIEQVLFGCYGIYDVCLINQVGEVVVMFCGKFVQICGYVILVFGSLEFQFDFDIKFL